MPTVKLFILEVEKAELDKIGSLYSDKGLELSQNMGSSPRYEGANVEGLTVPPGKVWLFPIGGDFKRLEKCITGVRLIQKVNL